MYSMLSEPQKQQQAGAECCVLSLRMEEDKLYFDRNEMVTDTCAADSRKRAEEEMFITEQK